MISRSNHLPLALAALGFVLACGQPMDPRDPTPGSFHLKIKSFNVEQEHSSDHATVEAVGSSDADILSLQEVTPQWEAVLRERYSAQYEHMLFRSEPDAGGLAVLSRYPVVDQGFHPGPNDWHPAWHVGVQTPEGPLQLLNVHLRAPLNGRDSALDAALNTGEDHLASIEGFQDECEDEVPTIILGDFNEDVDGQAIRFLENLGFTNSLPLFHPGQPTWRYRSVGGQFDGTFDHILFDDSFLPLNAWVTVEGNSDHLPVVAHLEAAPN